MLAHFSLGKQKNINDKAIEDLEKNMKFYERWCKNNATCQHEKST